MSIVTRLCLLLLVAGLSAAPAASLPDTLTIIHLNDTHSNLAPIGPRDASLKGTLGGIARLATLIGSTKQSAPNVVTLHAGDSFIGDIFFNRFAGAVELGLLKAIGVDAMAVGNHEFDLTPACLQMGLDSAFVGGGFPLVSCNIDLTNDTVRALKAYIAPWTIIDRGNIRVGIFGLTTPATNVLSLPQPAIVLEDVVPPALAAIDSLTAHGCTVIICLSHMGIALDEQLAASLPGVNVFVGGHDHLKTETPHAIPNPGGDTTYVVQANAFYLNAGIMTLEVNGSSVRLIGYEMKDIDTSIPEEPGIAAAVNSFIAEIEATYGPLYTQRIGYAREDFEEVAACPTADGPMDTPVGNFVTDVFQAALKTDVALEVGGSTAQKIFHGPLVAADLFRVVGYGFNTENGLGYHLATMNMTGEALVMGLELGLSDIETDDEFLAQVAGMSYTYNAHRPVGSRVVSVEVGGAPLDPLRTYSVAVNEFVPVFLAFKGIPFSDLHVCSGDTTEFQVLAAAVAAADTIAPYRAQRVTSPVRDENAPRPGNFNLYQNYPNPFNPSTRITFDIPERVHVRIDVFDMRGRRVATLMDGICPQGRHVVEWNAAGLASGIYLCRLTAGGLSALRKVILLK